MLTIRLSYLSFENRHAQPVGFEVSEATEHSSEKKPYIGVISVEIASFLYILESLLPLFLANDDNIKSSGA